MLTLVVIAGPPLALAIMLATAFAALAMIFRKVGVGIDLELVAYISIVFLALGYGCAGWFATGHWSVREPRMPLANRSAIVVAIAVLGAAFGYCAFIVAANMGVDTSFH